MCFLRFVNPVFTAKDFVKTPEHIIESYSVLLFTYWNVFISIMKMPFS